MKLNEFRSRKRWNSRDAVGKAWKAIILTYTRLKPKERACRSSYPITAVDNSKKKTTLVILHMDIVYSLGILHVINDYYPFP